MPRMNRKPGEKAKDFKGTLKKLIKYAGRYRIGIIAVMICAIASATFSIVSPKILGKANKISRRFNVQDFRNRQY